MKSKQQANLDSVMIRRVVIISRSTLKVLNIFKGNDFLIRQKYYSYFKN